MGIQGQPFPVFSSDTAIPADLANSLTASLLNQSFELQAQPQAQTYCLDGSSSNVRSRKENKGRHVTCPIPLTAPLGSLHADDHYLDQRKVSQQMFVPIGSDHPASLADLQADVISARENTNFPANLFGEDLSGENKGSTLAQKGSLAARTPGSERGTKRARHRSPDSARTLDVEDVGGQRKSPLVRISSIEDTPGNATIDALE